MSWCSIVYWLQCSNDVNNFAEVHKSEKRRPVTFNSASRFVDNIPVPEFAHGILEWPESLDRYLYIYKPVNSISISGMVTGQWKVKPRWPPMVANFGRQFQFPTQVCRSVLVSPATFYLSWEVFVWKYTQNISSKHRNEFNNFKYISTTSNWVTGCIFSRK